MLQGSASFFLISFQSKSIMIFFCFSSIIFSSRLVSVSIQRFQLCEVDFFFTFSPDNLLKFHKFFFFSLLSKLFSARFKRLSVFFTHLLNHPLFPLYFPRLSLAVNHF